MLGLSQSQWFLVAIGGVVMGLVMLRAIFLESYAVAGAVVIERRAAEAKRKADNAAAEAAGRAAALEPLALNPDGTIEEPVVGVVEAG